MDSDRWIGIDDAAAALGLDEEHVSALLAEGRIPHFRHQIGGEVLLRIREEDLSAYLASTRVTPAARKDAPPLDGRTTPDVYGVTDALKRTRDVTPRSYVVGLQVLEQVVFRLAQVFDTEPVGSARYVRFRVRGHDGTLYAKPQKRHVRLTLKKSTRNVDTADNGAIVDVIGWVAEKWGFRVEQLMLDDELSELLSLPTEGEE